MFRHVNKSSPTLSVGAVEYADCSSERGCPGYETKLHIIVRLTLGALGNVKYSFIAMTPRSPLTQIGSNSLSPIYGSNRTNY